MAGKRYKRGNDVGNGHFAKESESKMESPNPLLIERKENYKQGKKYNTSFKTQGKQGSNKLKTTHRAPDPALRGGGVGIPKRSSARRADPDTQSGLKGCGGSPVRFASWATAKIKLMKMGNGHISYHKKTG